MKMHIDLYHHKSIPHLNQIFTGFKLLADKGLINLNVNKKSDPVFKDSDLPIIRVKLNNKVNLVYDTLDGYRFDHDCSLRENVKLLDQKLATCDYYFKRSYSKELNQALNNTNIYKLGLNYKVYNTLYNELSCTKVLSKNFTKGLIERSKLLADLFNHEYYRDTQYENLWSLPLIKDDFFYPKSILFLTRPWDPDEKKLPDDLIQERHKLNEFRANCIRACKKEYGSNFIGGFTDSSYARAKYPDLVVPKLLTGKSNYIKIMREASICIATTGLHDSIGWKFGEYVSHSKAILSEPLKYELPGDFSDPENYLTFNSVDSLLSKINDLKSDQKKIVDMMQRNHAYYHGWVRPDKLILNTLLQAASLL